MLTNIQAQNRQQRSNLLNKDLQAISLAQSQLPFKTQRLERELNTIQQEQAPKAEDFKEIKPQEEEIDYRQAAVENLKAQQATPEMKEDTQVSQPTTIEDIGVPSTDYQPQSDIAPQEGLTAAILRQAEQMAIQAGLMAQENQINQSLDTISGIELNQPITANVPTNQGNIGPTSSLPQDLQTGPTKTQIQPTTSQSQTTPQQAQSMLPDDFSKQAGSKWQHGYQFKSGKDDIAGHCGWYAQQFTTLQDGSNWTIGSKISDKKKQFAGHVQKGDAFYLGKDVPQVGNSIIFNGGDWGHVAVIAKINPDGTAVLDESNFNNDKRVTKNRVVKLSDPSIIGFMRTKIRNR
jgi:surface antigen